MKNTLTVIFAAASALFTAVSCGTTVPVTLTEEESVLIHNSPDVMRILSEDDEAYLEILRSGTRNLNVPDLNTPEYGILVRKMIQTLESCDECIGLAAPEVGINRRLVAVKRIDKEGEPIEVYPNLRITDMNEYSITISYTDINSDRPDQPREIRETVSGPVAAIFRASVLALG